jgi:hypothetical protein
MPQGVSYSKDEVETFLDAVEEGLLITLTARERVTEVHLLRYPDLNWTVYRPQEKIQGVAQQEIPTGDPHCSPCYLLGKSSMQGNN